jgi:hypothetical protein
MAYITPKFLFLVATLALAGKLNQGQMCRQLFSRSLRSER